jgi:hypothetical protein
MGAGGDRLPPFAGQDQASNPMFETEGQDGVYSFPTIELTGADGRDTLPIYRAASTP